MPPDVVIQLWLLKPGYRDIAGPSTPVMVIDPRAVDAPTVTSQSANAIPFAKLVLIAYGGSGLPSHSASSGQGVGWKFFASVVPGTPRKYPNEKWDANTRPPPSKKFFTICFSDSGWARERALSPWHEMTIMSYLFRTVWLNSIDTGGNAVPAASPGPPPVSSKKFHPPAP